VGNLERAGVPRSAAMKMVGHKTQSIYSRYAIADEGMLKDAALKLARLHDADESWRRSVDSIGGHYAEFNSAVSREPSRVNGGIRTCVATGAPRGRSAS